MVRYRWSSSFNTFVEFQLHNASTVSWVDWPNPVDFCFGYRISAISCVGNCRRGWRLWCEATARALPAALALSATVPRSRKGWDLRSQLQLSALRKCNRQGGTYWLFREANLGHAFSWLLLRVRVMALGLDGFGVMAQCYVCVLPL